jgi:hypothetical protein
MTPFTIDKPSPVPLPFSFVVKKGLKMRGRNSDGMPVPVSETLQRTNFFQVCVEPSRLTVSQSDDLVAESNLAPLGHGIMCVDAQVEEHLGSTGSIDLHLGGLRGGLQFEGHLAPQEPLSKRSRLLNDVIEIENGDLLFAGPAEAEQLLGEVPGAAGCVVHLFQPGARLGIQIGIEQKQADVAANRQQQIVEIVSDANGKGTNGAKFLCVKS